MLNAIYSCSSTISFRDCYEEYDENNNDITYFDENYDIIMKPGYYEFVNNKVKRILYSPFPQRAKNYIYFFLDDIYFELNVRCEKENDQFNGIKNIFRN